MSDETRYPPPLEVFRWMIFRRRRPGMLGVPHRFSGLDANGLKVELFRQGDQWTFRREGSQDEILRLDQIMLLLGGKPPEIQLETVHIVPQLASLLFQGAVESAEKSLNEFLTALETFGLGQESSEERQNALLQIVLGPTHLDRAVRAAMAGVVLAVAAAEAQLNEWAESLSGWRRTQDEDEDRLSLTRKCKTLAAKVGTTIDIGRDPFQSLQSAVDLRTRLVHSKPIPEPMPVVQEKAPLPGYFISVEARRACYAVRRTLIEMAKIIGLASPSYLAFCPPSDPEDDNAWRNAAFLTGTRKDPDFPSLQVSDEDQKSAEEAT